MLVPLLLLTAYAAPPMNPVTEAITRFQHVNTYEATVTVESAGQVEQMRYHYQKPGYLRLEFIQPHPGLVLTYNPISQQVHVWPSGFHHFPSFHTSPDNSLIRSQAGHRIDQSDAGYFWHHVQRLQAQGSYRVAGNAGAATKMIHLLVEGAPGIAVDQYHKFDIRLEPLHFFPIRATGYDLDGHELDTVTMQDLQFNITFPPDFFD
jgi:hypothetical protein